MTSEPAGHLEILDERVGESDLTREDVDELAQRINDRAREQVFEGEGSADRLGFPYWPKTVFLPPTDVGAFT